MQDTNNSKRIFGDQIINAYRVIPGSHLAGKLSESVAAEIAKVKKSITCEMSAGGVLLMRPLLLHSSSASLIPGHRRVVHLDYAKVSLPEELNWFH